MTRRSPLYPMISLALAASAAPASAQVAQTSSTAQLIYPATVHKVDDLRFGGIANTAAGTIVIDPNSGAIITTGGVVRTDSAAQAASFVGAAGKQTVVNIRIPKVPITLQQAGGTETLTVSNWTLQGQDKRTLASQTTLNFRVGPTLAVPADAVEGTYSGNFTIEVQYP